MKMTLLFFLFSIIQSIMPPQNGSNWINKTYEITGDWSIDTKDEGTFLVLEENFHTIKGPDLKLYLVKREVEDIGNRESVDQEGLFIAELASHKGSQQYLLPEVDLSKYKAIVIHCKRYSVVWGGLYLP